MNKYIRYDIVWKLKGDTQRSMIEGRQTLDNTIELLNSIQFNLGSCEFEELYIEEHTVTTKTVKTLI